MANNTGKKYGGREKGIPNRMTKQLRSILKDRIVRRDRSITRSFRRFKTERKGRVAY